MVRRPYLLAIALALSCALAPGAYAAPKDRAPAAPPADDKPAAPPPAAPDEHAPPEAPAVSKKCKLPGGGVRVLTIAQKQCRKDHGCSCAEACPPCAP